MKKTSKEFWVNRNVFSEIKDVMVGFWDISLGTSSRADKQYKITISWEEPEKKIEISESEVDDIIEKNFGTFLKYN